MIPAFSFTTPVTTSRRIHLLSSSLAPTTCRRLFVSAVRHSAQPFPYKACSQANSTGWQQPSSPSFEPPSQISDTFSNQPPTPPQLQRISTSLWQFSRPHTVYGTILSVLSMTSIAYITSTQIPYFNFIAPLFTSLIPALLLNVYIVGLNQLFDVPIDRVNKPYLPLASGAMTPTDARIVILTTLVLGLSFCFLPFPFGTTPLRVVLAGSVALGTLYSVPPFRLKRFALLASIAILTVRGLLVNLCFFLHAALSTSKSTISTSAATATLLSTSSSTTTSSLLPTLSLSLFGVSLPPVITFATAFFTVFGIVIALLKDVPDIKGDRLFGIRTFSVRVGARSIFRACVAALVSMFLSAAAFYFFVTKGVLGRCVSLVLHVGMAAFLALRARDVDTSNPTSVTQYYMLSWKAFYAEYLFLPFAAL